MLKKLITSLIAVIPFVCFTVNGAQAAVITAGCASATSCTLEELFNGGSITVGDVTFDNTSLDSGLSQGSVQADASAIIVTGVEAPTTATLNFNFLPANISLITGDFIDFIFDMTATITGVRTFDGATLTYDPLNVLGTTDGYLAYEAQFNGSGGPLLAAFLDRNPTRIPIEQFAASESVALTGSSLAIQLLVLSEVFGTGGLADVAGFSLELSLAGDAPASEVPLPAALPLMIAGLAGFRFIGRRKKTS